jgi:putative endonuclease
VDSSQNMGDYRRRVGRRGEEVAVAYLKQQGYSILVRNWRCSAGELDIVAREGETLAFVEVRTRRGDRYGTPEESITPAKQAKLVELAQTYLQENNLTDQNWRIDVVAVEMDRRGRVKRLNLIRNAVWGSVDQ